MILLHSRGGTSHQIWNTLVSHHQMYKSAHLFLSFSTPLWLKLGRVTPPFKGWPLQVCLGLCPSEYLSNISFNLLHQFSPFPFFQLLLSNVNFLCHSAIFSYLEKHKSKTKAKLSHIFPIFYLCPNQGQASSKRILYIQFSTFFTPIFSSVCTKYIFKDE